MEQRARPKHFSMIRGFHLADFLTLANAACGVGAIFLTMLYLQSGAKAHFYAAAAMAPLAFFFDWLDGNVARWRHQHSALGRELDSLSDVISFGVAPAALAYAAGLDGGWDAAALIYFVCCGVSRLARFNVTAETLAAGSDSGKVAYFEGTPIPDQRGANRGARLRRVAGAHRRTHLRWRLGSRLAIPSAVAAVHRLGQHDDQQDPAHSEAVNRQPGSPKTVV